jgi:hypothetical protein
VHPAPDRAQRGARRRAAALPIVHTAKLWEPGERPRLERHVLEGDPGLSI